MLSLVLVSRASGVPLKGDTIKHSAATMCWQAALLLIVTLRAHEVDTISKELESSRPAQHVDDILRATCAPSSTRGSSHTLGRPY
jgi:hypothetical protein